MINEDITGTEQSTPPTQRVPKYETARQAGFQPIHVAAALSIMVMTCAEVAKLWATAVGEDPSVAWEMYAQTVAVEVASVPGD